MSKDEAILPIADMVESELPSEPEWLVSNNNPVKITIDHVTKITIFSVCGWSLIETPWEIGALSINTWFLALVVSKLVVILIAGGAIARVRVARVIFALICGAGVLAIAPALAFVYTRSVEIAALSTVECVLKAACLGALCLSSFRNKSRKRRASTVDPGMR